MQMRIFSAAASFVLFSVLAARASATDISEISVEEYYGAAYFKQAVDHPKVASKSRTQQIAAVARDMHWQPKTLTKAIAKVESLDGDPVELATAAIKSAMGGTRLGTRVLDVLINAEEPKHVVVYVRFQASTQKEVVKDASTIASVVASKTPFVSTLSLSAIHPKAKADSTTSVWSGKIGREAMKRIQESRIADYADRLYKPLFEGVEEKPF
jgi:hypothetical protein